MIGVDNDLIRRIGSNIGDARKRAGLSVEQVAHGLKMSPDRFRGIEAGDIEACSELDLLTFLRLVRCLKSTATIILMIG